MGKVMEGFYHFPVSLVKITFVKIAKARRSLTAQNITVSTLSHG